jgi:phytoene synthase
MYSNKPITPARSIRSTPQRHGGGRNREALTAKARDSIEKGSKSFAAASRLFDRPTRERVWLLYAWCRACDDIADGQEFGGTLRLGDKKDALDRVQGIKALTARALDGLPTADVAFDAFGMVAQECRLTHAMAQDVIDGFVLDAAEWHPRTERDLMQYCFHVAGAVGAMMAQVMGVAPDDHDTLDRACDLGLAFQLANIARDIAEDDSGARVYIPSEWLAEMGIPPGEHMKPAYRPQLAMLAARLIDRMDDHAAAARLGAARLPFRSRWAILAATRIYTSIGHKVRARGEAAWDSRVHTSSLAKLGHVCASFGEALINRPKNPAQMPQFSRRDFVQMPVQMPENENGRENQLG